jgi:CRISPR-associated protein Cmr2
MPGHLLLISLGPIQDFIASARRCQDLWFGSWLLSELSRQTAIGVQKKAGADCLIFPAAFGNDKPAVANKIVARLAPEHHAADVAKAGKDAMQDRLRELAEKLFDQMPRHRYFKRDLAMQQVAELMEYMWVAVPITDGDYGKARGQAEHLLSWRKHTRAWTFEPREIPYGIPKSSMDGQRESVLDEALYRDPAFPPEERRRVFFVKKSERLCGVGLLKRLGEDPDFNEERRPKFYSNSHIASAPLRARINQSEAHRAALREYHQTLGELNVDRARYTPRSDKDDEEEQELDGYLLFEDRLPEVFELYAGPMTETVRADRLLKAQKALQQLFAKIGQEEPPLPYYALLMADGDRMGQAIDALKQPEQHQELSQALEEFSGRCKHIVQAHQGGLIYAGGDDVLALLPLHTALSCADRLRQEFHDRLEAACASCERKPTLSVGLGIAHHLSSMTEARALARRAEQLAKQRRDSLAIVVDKRGGAPLEITGTWNEAPPLHQRIEQWCRLLHDEKLPDSVAYGLEEAMRPLLTPNPAHQGRANPAEVGDVAASLARLVLARKRSGRGEAALDESTRTLLESRLSAQREDPIRSVLALSTELQIARLFSRAHADAGTYAREALS